MSLPVYFVSPGQTAPARGKLAACGWHCAPDGRLQAPESAAQAEALVFDDRNPLSEADSLPDELIAAAQAISAQVIVLDFERQPSPAALALAGHLSGRVPTAAPLPFCTGSCMPILCYAPSLQTFPEFLKNACGWIELRPIRETVRFSHGADVMPDKGQDYFSELLQCRYRAKQEADALTLELFDTSETFQARYRLLRGRFDAAIGIQNELEAFGLTDTDI